MIKNVCGKQNIETIADWESFHQNKTQQNKTKTKQNKTKQNKTQHNTKQNKTLRRSLIGKVSVPPKRADTSYCQLLLWFGQHTEANKDEKKYTNK